MIEDSAFEEKMQKLIEKLEEDFVKDVRKMSPEQLKEKALSYAKEVERVEDEKNAHEGLNKAKEVAATLNKGFRDAKKYASIRMQFVLAVMKEKGLE